MPSTGGSNVQTHEPVRFILYSHRQVNGMWRQISKDGKWRISSVDTAVFLLVSFYVTIYWEFIYIFTGVVSRICKDETMCVVLEQEQNPRCFIPDDNCYYMEVFSYWVTLLGILFNLKFSSNLYHSPISTFTFCPLTAQSFCCHQNFFQVFLLNFKIIFSPYFLDFLGRPNTPFFQFIHFFLYIHYILTYLHSPQFPLLTSHLL